MTKKVYRVRNWANYNKSLVNRGSITYWFSENIVKEWCQPPKTNTGRGRPEKYPDSFIRAALTLRQLFNLTLRATEGFVRSLIAMLKMPCKTPNYTTLSVRSKQLNIPLYKTKQHHPRSILVDSTGVQVIGEGEWKTLKHGRSRHQLWRKLHLVIDSNNQEILSMKMTDSIRFDANYLKPLIDQINCPIGEIIGDGAYDKKSCYKVAHEKNAKPIFPPQHNARKQPNKYKKNPALEPRDKAIDSIGRGPDREVKLKKWKEDNGYHKRSLIETTMSRLKSIFGDQMRSRCEDRQRTDLAIRCYILNKMTTLGMPKSVAVF